MKRQTLVLTIFGAIILIFFGYWMFDSVVSQKNNNSETKSSVTAGTKSSAITLNDLLDKYNFKINNSNTTSSNNLGINSPAQNNYTDTINKDLSGQFISAIQSGMDASSSANAIDFNPTTLTQISQQSILALNNVPKNSELNIINDNSLEASRKYFITALPLLISSFSSLPTGFNDKAISNIFEKGDSSLAQLVLKTNDKLISDLEKTPVPEKYVDLHKKIITQLRGISFAYDALINYQTDPFKLLSLETYLGDMDSRVNSLMQVVIAERSKVF